MFFYPQKVKIHNFVNTLAIAIFITIFSPLQAEETKAQQGDIKQQEGTKQQEETKQQKEETTLWKTDFQNALALSQKSKKPLLLNFSGSDWCKWCIRLDNEVFKTPEFLTWVKDNLVLCLADLPQDHSTISKAQYEKNQKLSQKYEVKGFPTILLLNSDGSVFAKTGYVAGGPEKYIENLKQLIKDKDWQKNLTNIDKLKEDEQLKLAVYIFTNKYREISPEDRIKLSYIIFSGEKNDNNLMKAAAAMELALDDNDAIKQSLAIKWLKKLLENGNSEPYSIYLFSKATDSFNKLMKEIDKNKKGSCSTEQLNKSAKAVLEQTKELKKMISPKAQDKLNLIKQCDVWDAIAIATLGEKEKALKSVDAIFKDHRDMNEAAKEMKIFIEAIGVTSIQKNTNEPVLPDK